MPRSQEREKRLAAGEKRLPMGKKSAFGTCTYKVPLRDVVDLKSQGYRKSTREIIIISRPYLLRVLCCTRCTVRQDEVRRRVFDFRTVRGNKCDFC